MKFDNKCFNHSIFKILCIIVESKALSRNGPFDSREALFLDWHGSRRKSVPQNVISCRAQYNCRSASSIILRHRRLTG